MQQDNDPTHWVAKKLIKEWCVVKVSSVQMLPSWPPSSPKLSPIDNFWGWVNAKVDETGCKSFGEFQLTAQSTTKNVPKYILRAYFNSMKAKMAQNLDLEGAKMSY